MPRLTKSKMKQNLEPFKKDQTVFQIDLDGPGKVIVSGKKGKSGLFVKMSVSGSTLTRHECIEVTDEQYGIIANANVVEKGKKNVTKVQE